MIALELATGLAPYTDCGSELLARVAAGDHHILDDHFSVDCRAFVTACLCMDPKGRPTAQDLLLHPFLQKPATDLEDARLELIDDVAFCRIITDGHVRLVTTIVLVPWPPITVLGYLCLLPASFPPRFGSPSSPFPGAAPQSISDTDTGVLAVGTRRVLSRESRRPA